MIAADGITYERRAIAAWLKKSTMSPLTNNPLPHKMLTPNVLVRGMCRRMAESGC